MARLNVCTDKKKNKKKSHVMYRSPASLLTLGMHNKIQAAVSTSGNKAMLQNTVRIVSDRMYSGGKG